MLFLPSNVTITSNTLRGVYTIALDVSLTELQTEETLVYWVLKQNAQNKY